MKAGHDHDAHTDENARKRALIRSLIERTRAGEADREEDQVDELPGNVELLFPATDAGARPRVAEPDPATLAEIIPFPRPVRQ